MNKRYNKISRITIEHTPKTVGENYVLPPNERFNRNKRETTGLPYDVTHIAYRGVFKPWDSYLLANADAPVPTSMVVIARYADELKQMVIVYFTVNG